MIFQSIKMAWQSIASSKMRSFLTMLGIIIGVTALVVMVSLVNGATGKVTDEIASIGKDQLSVYVFDDKHRPLNTADIDALMDTGEFSRIAPLTNANFTAKHGYKKVSVQAYGTTPAYQAINGAEIARGRYLKTADVENSSYVCVLADSTATRLFGTSDPVGQYLLMNGRRFLVVGVLKGSTGSSMMFSFGYSYDVYVPYTVAARITGSNGFSSLYATGADATSNDAAEAALNDYLYKRFGKDDEAYYVDNMSRLMQSMSEVTSTMSLLLGGIAAISLLVGGIGIMNIMLVSVTERTQEIGIRKAIGAGRGSIMLQFLIEAVMVSLMGCAIGLLLSSAILRVATALAAAQQISFAMDPGVILIAVAFSSAIGLIFGLYPANKAARMHPIEALRYQG